MKIQKDYSLEQLTAESVNVVEISIARSRMAYVNSPTGRKQLTETLPEEYVKAVLALWGENPTVSDPTA